MGLFVRPPFALFSLVDIPVETLNSILQQAHDGSTVDLWWIYLPSSSDYSPDGSTYVTAAKVLGKPDFQQFPYPLLDLQRVKLTSFKAAPQKKPEGGGSQATKAPLPSSFEPAFVGKTVTEVAAWLKNKPDKVLLEGRFFGVLDKKASGGKDGKENKVVLCRIGDKDGQGDKVQCVLMSAEESTLTLGGMEYGNFDELIEGKGEYVPEI